MESDNFLALQARQHATLNTFTLESLARFTRAGSFPAGDSPDFRVLEAGKDDVHGALKYILALTSSSLKFNMFGYDDDELDYLIQGLVSSRHVYVQGTLDSSQAGGVHEKKILANWSVDMRNSFAIGRSATGDISHTKGGVCDGVVAWEGSTNWSASGEGIGINLQGLMPPGFHAQNNTCAFFTNSVEISRFSTILDEQHATALQKQLAREAKNV